MRAPGLKDRPAAVAFLDGQRRRDTDTCAQGFSAEPEEFARGVEQRLPRCGYQQPVAEVCTVAATTIERRDADDNGGREDSDAALAGALLPQDGAVCGRYGCALAFPSFQVRSPSEPMTVDIDFGRIAQFGVVAPSFNGPDGPLITAGATTPNWAIRPKSISTVI